MKNYQCIFTSRDGLQYKLTIGDERASDFIPFNITGLIMDIDDDGDVLKPVVGTKLKITIYADDREDMNPSNFFATSAMSHRVTIQRFVPSVWKYDFIGYIEQDNRDQPLQWQFNAFDINVNSRLAVIDAIPIRESIWENDELLQIVTIPNCVFEHRIFNDVSRIINPQKDNSVAYSLKEYDIDLYSLVDIEEGESYSYSGAPSSLHDKCTPVSIGTILKNYATTEQLSFIESGEDIIIRNSFDFPYYSNAKNGGSPFERIYEAKDIEIHLPAPPLGDSTRSIIAAPRKFSLIQSTEIESSSIVSTKKENCIKFLQSDLTLQKFKISINDVSLNGITIYTTAEDGSYLFEPTIDYPLNPFTRYSSTGHMLIGDKPYYTYRTEKAWQKDFDFFKATPLRRYTSNSSKLKASVAITHIAEVNGKFVKLNYGNKDLADIWGHYSMRATITTSENTYSKTINDVDVEHSEDGATFSFDIGDFDEIMSTMSLQLSINFDGGRHHILMFHDATLAYDYDEEYVRTEVSAINRFTTSGEDKSVSTGFNVFTKRNTGIGIGCIAGSYNVEEEFNRRWRIESETTYIEKHPLLINQINLYDKVALGGQRFLPSSLHRDYINGIDEVSLTKLR